MEFIAVSVVLIGAIVWLRRRVRQLEDTALNLCQLATYQVQMLSFYGNLVNRMLEQHGVPMRTDEQPDVGVYND